MRHSCALHILVIFLALSITSCNEEEVSPDSVSPVVETDLPETGIAGQEITFTVSHIVWNGCGYYSTHNTVQLGNTYQVTYYAKYRDGACTMNIPVLQTAFSFTPPNPGTYTFRFTGEDGNMLIQTIDIN